MTTFSKPFILPSSIRIGVDKFGKDWINNILIYDLETLSNSSTGFIYWRVIDYAINAGDCIVFEGQNEGSNTAFGFAIEAYSVNSATLQTLTSIAQVDADVAWSTRTATIEWLSCTNSGVLNTTNPCAPTCTCS